MHVFTIAPAGMRPLWILVPVVLVVLGVLAVLLVSMLGSRGTRFEVSDTGLRLRGDWYGRFIPADALMTDLAQRVDLSPASDLRPARRTWGTGLPGYQAGWFRLASGETALLYLTDHTRAVRVPTRLGYSLLLSPDDPDGFLVALRSAGATR
jgi:hypothetical protein